MKCTYRLSLNELLARPAGDLRLVGSDGEGENGSGDQGGSNSGQGGDGDNNSGSGGDNGGGDKGDKGASSDPKDRKIASLEEEKQRHYDLRKQAEADLATANEKIAKLEKDGTTDEDTKRKLVDNERTIADQEVVISDLRLENTFLKSNKYKWRNTGAALKLADLSKVRIDEKTGDVFGLDDALKALADDSPWLLEADDGNDDDKSKDKDKQKQRRTGTPPANDKSKDDKSAQAEKARLQSKYPGLRR